MHVEVPLADGRRLNAVQLQWEYFEHAKKYVEREDDTPTSEILERWEAILTSLESEPLSLHRELDWVAKFRLLEAYRERGGLDRGDPKLHAIDLQYHDVRREKGLYYRLERSGKVDRLVDDADVERAVMEPPEDTRAYFRGRCIGKYRMRSRPRRGTPSSSIPARRRSSASRCEAAARNEGTRGCLARGFSGRRLLVAALQGWSRSSKGLAARRLQSPRRRNHA